MQKCEISETDFYRHKESPWFYIISNGAESADKLIGNIPLYEVLMALDRLKEINRNGLALTNQEEKIIRITLEWKDTARGGTDEIRKRWDKIGIPYKTDISSASSEIFRREWAPSDEDMKTAKNLDGLDENLKYHLEQSLGDGVMLAMTVDEEKVIAELIRTCDIFTRQLDKMNDEEKSSKILSDTLSDGVITTELKGLKEAYKPFGGEAIRTILYYLNESIIESRDACLWEKIRDEIYMAIIEVVEYLES